MALAVLFDAVGEVAQTPIFDLGDVPAALFDEGFQLFVQRFSLLRRDILPRDDHVLVESHDVLLPLRKAAQAGHGSWPTGDGS